MSETNYIHDSYDPSEFDYFAFVVDSEVAVVIPIRRTGLPAWAAAWASDPKVIKLADAQKQTVQSGWTWNGAEFNPPA